MELLLWCLSSDELTNQRTEGLVGNGRSVVIATSSGFRYHRGGSGEGTIHMSHEGNPLDLAKLTWKTITFPGGIVFTHHDQNGDIESFQTALSDDPFGVLVRLTGKYARDSVAVEGGPKLQPRLAAANDLNGRHVFGFSETGKIANHDFDALQGEVLAPYLKTGMTLHSPDLQLDQAVLFNQYLLDLSYNGNLIVCELFRWADIWSRDLGSGFVPGCIVTNRIEPARKCIDVDLARYEKATARALKTTEDASQGGSAEGVSHLTYALWDYYLATGDLVYLARVAEGIRPWVDAWVARDYAHNGLIIDTTDWMDHSRYNLLPFGVKTLYANALMVRLLDTFAHIEKELGHAAAATRYEGDRDRFIAAINERLWSENLGAYSNLLVSGQEDERTASAANSLALLGGVASPERATRVLTTLKEKNWRPSGTLTITPRMTYFPDNDQNEKIWPWWMAYEALARFRNGDPDGGLRLLDNCAATIRNPKYPGMMDETMSEDGHSEGGRAFATAAGSLLTSITNGLFGIDVLTGGMREVKIIPNLPKAWKNASLHQPTPGGSIDIDVCNRVPYITVHDPRIKIIHTSVEAVVIGAWKQVWKAPLQPKGRAGTPVTVPPLIARTAVVFEEPGFPSPSDVHLDPKLPRIGWNDLVNIDASKTSALVIAGNALPFFTPDGKLIQNVLDRFLAKGGLLIFQGATMRPNGGMGNEGGVIEWYAHSDNAWRPVHPRTGAPEPVPKRDGVVYSGNGHYFGGWDAGWGAFGFHVDGRGFSVPSGSPLLCKNESADAPIEAAFTDFAVSSPWYFQPLATTHTTYNFLFPAKGENLSCAARLVNRDTHGEIILIAKGAEPFIDLASLLSPSTTR